MPALAQVLPFFLRQITSLEGINSKTRIDGGFALTTVHKFVSQYLKAKRTSTGAALAVDAGAVVSPPPRKRVKAYHGDSFVWDAAVLVAVRSMWTTTAATVNPEPAAAAGAAAVATAAMTVTAAPFSSPHQTATAERGRGGAGRGRGRGRAGRGRGRGRGRGTNFVPAVAGDSGVAAGLLVGLRRDDMFPGQAGETCCETCGLVWDESEDALYCAACSLLFNNDECASIDNRSVAGCGCVTESFVRHRAV